MVIFFELALTFYFAAVIAGVVDLFRKVPSGMEGKSSEFTVEEKFLLGLTATGFLCHSANILWRLFATGHMPVTSLHEAASFFAWALVVLFFYIEYRYRIGLLGSFVMPVVFMLMLSASVLPREIKPLSPKLKSYWLWVHTTLAFVGDAAFAMAAGVGLMYILQERFVKKKHLGSLFHRLPSLKVLDEINYRLIGIGFPFLSLAIITGSLWSQSVFGTFWQWDPKEVWSLITWFIYVFVLHARLRQGWRGRKAAYMSILGFLIVIFTFFGVNLLMKGYHSFVQ